MPLTKICRKDDNVVLMPLLYLQLHFFAFCILHFTFHIAITVAVAGKCFELLIADLHCHTIEHQNKTERLYYTPESWRKVDIR